MDIISSLTKMFGLQRWQVENTVNLIDEGNTIPFIARYRKEAHGTLDDQVLRELSEKLEYLRNLDKRREEISALITAQEKMTPEIEAALEKASTLAEIEDIYRPFRPKRRTRASIAKEKGLEPLADAIFAQAADSASPSELAADYIDAEKGVETLEDAIGGAMDIIAENISDDADIRRRLRSLFTVAGVLQSRAADSEKESVYTMYYEYDEPINKIAGHRVLAVNRGENEGFLKVGIEVDRIKALNIINACVLSDSGSACTDTVRDAAADAYDRLIFPSVEREIRNMMTDNAVESALKVFYVNLRELLLQPPVKGKRALGLDPGYRTGCKVAVVDETGKVLDTGVIYVTHSEEQKLKAKQTVKRLIEKHGVEVIAIGNGTASKETEIFAADLIKELDRKVSYMMVSEAGASVYSASKLAAEEFPQYDVNLRSAVSIARRLQDPLAELVKIDAKSIGVGQYQHDVDQTLLKKSLDQTVESCVNLVGVNLNTASRHLLTYISGLGPALAQNIVDYRTENGPFSSRKELLKVPRMGAKAFEQCAGFLRIPQAKNPLDNSAVHPESYPIVEQIAKDLNCTVDELIKSKELRSRIDIKKYVTPTVGLPTLTDIMQELDKPGRDPRQQIQVFEFDKNVKTIEDLTEGMELPGIVNNITNFGCFVDIGIKEKGLVHVSQLADKFVSDPTTVVSIHQHVRVKVMSIDLERKRIQLTMKGLNQ